MQNEDRVILHFDMDCFYCQVEAKRLGVPPTTPLVVDQWGMLLSVNYPAKAIGISRKTSAKDAAAMGAIVAHVRVVDIESGEKYDDINSAYRDRTLYKASLDRYRDASEEVMTVMKQALPLNAAFERASIDECFIDVTGQDLFDMFPDVDDVDKLRWEGGEYDMSLACDQVLARGALLGERIRSEVISVTGYIASCGVSLTRQVAKLSCALNKPNKLTVVSTKRTTEFMRTVPIKEIRGLGPRAMETLQSRVSWAQGATPCGDLWQVDLGTDEFAKWMHEALRGLNDDQVKETSLTASSVQSSKQFRPPLPVGQVEAMLYSLTQDMVSRLEGRRAKTLVVTLQVGEVVRTRQDRYPIDQVDRLVKELAVKTGLMSQYQGFDRLAVTAKDVDAAGGAKREVAEYLSSSRLHFMGTWKTRYLQYVAGIEESGDWGSGDISDEAKKRSRESAELRTDCFQDGGTSPQRFLLVDMDCFFCSVAMAVNNINESIPCAVASGLGPTSEICSANYAARKFGVCASSFVSTAREKCPRIEILAIDTPTLERCETIWKKVIHILYLMCGSRFDRVQGKSCDEALMDLSGFGGNYAALADIGREIQEIVANECGVPCSVGIAPTRILAKLATTKAKPKGVRVIASIEEGINAISGDPVKSLPGIGYSNQCKLIEIGIETVGDLLRNQDRLANLLGAGTARKLIATAQGQDTEEDLSQNIQPLTVSAEKNFGLRNLSLDQARELLEALCGAAVERCPVQVGIEKAVLKLKLAGDDWVEPTKKGGVGDAHDWSRSVDTRNTANFFSVLAPLLRDIDTTRIRGIGVALKLKPPQAVGISGGTLEDFFSGKVVSTKRPLSPISKKRDVVMESDMVTSPCVVCGLEILPGYLTRHFASHLGEGAQVCPCPICFEPIELTDAYHVSRHFFNS